MSFAIDKFGSTLIVQPEGQINSANAVAFEADLMSQVDQGELRIVLDLAHLDYISSAGLRVVLLLAKKLKQAGGALMLCDLQPSVREVFEISGFLSILKVSDTRAEAIESSLKYSFQRLFVRFMPPRATVSERRDCHSSGHQAGSRPRPARTGVASCLSRGTKKSPSGRARPSWRSCAAAI